MTETVSFGRIQQLIADAEYLKLAQVLTRPSRWHGLGQRPNIMILTEKDLFFGGVEETKNSFTRIDKEDIVSVRKVGKSMLSCLEVKHGGEGGLNSVCFCPFTGHPSTPKIDFEEMEELKRLISDGRIQ